MFHRQSLGPSPDEDRDEPAALCVYVQQGVTDAHTSPPLLTHHLQKQQQQRKSALLQDSVSEAFRTNT